MDSLKIYKVLPLLEDYNYNVPEWIDEFKSIMRVCNIKDPERLFVWANEAVDLDLQSVLKSLVITSKSGTRYPTLKEIQKAIEEHLDITDSDKLDYIHSLVIRDDESIRSFNNRYRRLYHDLNRDYQSMVTVKNYRKSISSRNYPYSLVFTSGCTNLQEAYKIAETAEKAEQELNNTIGVQHNNYNNHVSMVTQNSSSSISLHPIYSSMNNMNNSFLATHISNNYPRRMINLGRNNNYESHYNNKVPMHNRNGYPNSRSNKSVTFSNVNVQEGINNSRRNNTNENLECFRCGQRGHKRSECPYSFRQLAELEEKAFKLDSGRRITPINQTNPSINLITLNNNLTQNKTSEVAVAAVRRNKSPSRIKTSHYKEKPQSLGNNPIPINTNAINYNKNFINNNISKQNSLNEDKLMSSIEINNIQDRQMDKATSNKEEVSTKEREKGEIIDLISEDIAMEANKPDSNNTNKEEKVSKETERLEQLDVSIINQENIGNEIKQQVQHNTPTNSSPDKLKKIEKHIRLMEGFKSFKIDDLVNEIASIEVVTKLANLLDVFPKLRTAFAQKLKLTPATTTNTITNVITAISNNKIVKVRGKIEDADAIILLDSCACLNMITKSALEKFKINKNPIGKISETIFQAFNMTEVETEIYELKVTIGSHTSYEQFRFICLDSSSLTDELGSSVYSTPFFRLNDLILPASQLRPTIYISL
ncbi:hypothetical protein H8356DRAFT_1321942 [Neocallimastix lanati (nom. inval.)]|nr:hypothetical protein H8356DRAFT_1321942 [Neocallimastix sp. JGI-2020a]